MYFLGIDVGNSAVKGAVVTDQGAKVVAIPSLFGVKGSDEPSREGRKTWPDEVEFEGVSYLVGQSAELAPIPRVRYLLSRNVPDLRALCYDAIYQLLGAGEHEVMMGVGVPISELIDQDRADVMSEVLRSWLVGPHRFRVNGESVDLLVEDVHTLAQPIGTFYAWCLDDEGKWSQGDDLPQFGVGVVDIGFETVAFIALDDGDLCPRYCEEEAIGMRQGAERLIKMLKDARGMTLSIREAEAKLKATPPVLQGDTEIQSFVDQVRDSEEARVLSIIRQMWDDGRTFDRLLFTGGGAVAMRGAIQIRYPGAVVLDRPVTANAVGLARYTRHSYRR